VELAGLAQEAQERAVRLERLEGELVEMEALVEELLTWSRLGAAPERLLASRVMLAPMFERLVGEARQAGAAVEGELEPGLALWGEERLVRRALQNGVGNALRYGRGRICLRGVRVADGVELSVEDDGPGLPPPDRQRVFEPFVRLEAARSKAGGGVGLGLALVDRILRAHRGRAWFGESRWGGAALRMHWPDPR
jgi:signal transduction histidine kinase